MITEVCPKCGKNECMSDIDGDITSYLCLGCGYRTKSDYHVKNLLFQPNIVRMNESMKKLFWKDPNTGLYWFPLDLSISGAGILEPFGDSIENIMWVYMPMIEPTDEQKRYYPGKKEIPDQYNKKIFKPENLKEALKLLKII